MQADTNEMDNRPNWDLPPLTHRRVCPTLGEGHTRLRRGGVGSNSVEGTDTVVLGINGTVCTL